MRVFVRTLGLDLYRAILSTRFALAVLSVVAVILIGSFGFISTANDVIYLLVSAFSSTGGTLILLGILPILPYGMSLAADTEERAGTFWLIRTGVPRYVLAKIIAAAASGFLVIIFGIALFVFAFSMYLPLFVTASSGDAYAVLLDKGRVFTYLSYLSAHYGLTAILFACLAITLSAYVVNKYIVLAAPIVIYLFLLRITTYIPLPEFLRPIYLFDAIYYTSNPCLTFVKKLIPILLLVFILSYIAVKKMKRTMGQT
jgi:hypothetical protein